MAVLWADFPSGQRGLYGTNTARMTDGIWAEVSSLATLVDDPDPNITGCVLLINDSNTTLPRARFALPVTGNTEGISFRLYLPSLPTNTSNTANVAFCDGSNAILFAVRVTTTGALEVRTGTSNNAIIGSGTQLGVTSGPVISANSWNQIEIKGTANAATGAVEIRVNTIPVLTLTNVNTGTGPIAQIRLISTNNTGASQGINVYWKDVIFWDTNGSELNDFLGALSVYDIVPDGDSTIGDWHPVTGSTGYNLVRDDFPAATLTCSGAISDGDTVRIDNTYYRFSSGTLDSGAPAGTSGNPWRVLIGGTVAESMENLCLAIGATGVAGTDYSTALTAHTTVDPQGFNATQIGVSAKIVTASSIVTTETGANLAWSAATLTDGPTDSSYISADSGDVTPAKFTMTDLPEDVIAVKAVLPIGRLIKTDGGDCNIEMAVSPNDIDYDAGSDRPITVANTYWWDVSPLSPDTGVAWTPTEVNDMIFRIDRTL